MVCLNARRFVACAFAVLVAGSLTFPPAALAIESGTVDGNAIANGEIVDRTFMGEACQCVTTGSDDQVELKASAKPAYYNGGSSAKGMPATGDRAMPLVVTLSVAALAAALGTFPLRSRRAEDRRAR